MLSFIRQKQSQQNVNKKMNKNSVIFRELYLDFSQSLKTLKNSNLLKVDGLENLQYDRREIRNILSFNSKNNKDWFLTSFLQTLMSESEEFNYEKYKYLLIASKYTCLFLSRTNLFTEEFKLSENEYEILKYKAIENANLYNPKFAKKLVASFKKKVDIKETDLSEFAKELNLDNEYFFNNQQSKVLFEHFVTEIQEQLKINKFYNFEELSYDVADYFSMKKETEKFLSLKNKNKSQVITENNYAEYSAYLLNKLDKIKTNLLFLDGDSSASVISALTITTLKVNLSDLPPMTPSQWVGLFFQYGIMLIWALIVLFPIVILIRSSFNSNIAADKIDLNNFTFSTQSYTWLFEKTGFVQWLTNSLVISVFTMVVTIFLISLTAYSFSRFRFRGKRSFIMALLVTQMVPTFTSLLVFYILTELLKSSIGIPPVVTLTIIYIGGGTASNTIILKGYMDSISQDIDDAARIDGCSHFWIYWNIILPVCKPILVVIALMSFIGPFGDIILPSLILKNDEDYTVAVGLNKFINSESKDYASYFAGSTLTAIPIGILFISLQKFVVSGMTMGGVKE